MKDNWNRNDGGMICNTCQFYVPKQMRPIIETNIGRCRRRAPTMSGFPVVFTDDWCGEHKLDQKVAIPWPKSPLFENSEEVPSEKQRTSSSALR